MKKLYVSICLLLLCFTVFGQIPALLKDINPTGNSVQYNYTIFNYNALGYFSADDGVHGYELWKTDGTEAGTSLFMDIDPGSTGSFPHSFGILNNKMIFSASNDFGIEKLWISDGTVAGTMVLKQISPYFNPPSQIKLMTPSGTLLFFEATDAVHGVELWETDGTTTGTFMVKDIDSIPGNSHSGLGSTTSFTVFNNHIYFAASESIHGFELWMSDGTAAGTRLVKDINPGSAGSMAFNNNLTVVGNKFFFTATDGVNGYELWVSDGTDAGTQMVKDIKTGSASAGIGEITAFNGKVYFQADNGVTGYELWSSDGTAAGTQLIKDINTGSNYSDPKYFCPYNNKLYFYAYTNADLDQLWVTDGTAAGTVKAKDVNPASNSGIFLTTVYNGRLYFTAFNGNNGRQLFELDGPTNVLKVISPTTITIDACAPGTYPSYFSIFNGSFFYPAVYDTSKGIEFYKLTTTPLGINTVNEKKAFTLYPNPAKAELQITNYELRGVKMESDWKEYVIYDLLGQPLLRGELKEKETEINISSLSSGFYFIKVNSVTIKFLKE